MTRLKVRSIPFQFGDTPFQWNPANPFFGFAMNGLSFVAPPFERYMVTAVHQAMPRIDGAAAHGLRAGPIAALSTLARDGADPALRRRVDRRVRRGRDVVDWYGGAK